MKHDEAKIQVAIVQLLLLKNLFFFSVPNELLGKSKNAALKMARFKAMGLRSGMTDLVIISSLGKAHFLEIKAPGGKLSDTQKNFQDYCIAHGWPHGVAYSVDDAITILDGWGL